MSMQQCCEPPSTQSLADLEMDAMLFKALGDVNRLAIVDALAQADRALCVCEFTKFLPLNQPTVSHHLKILRDSGVLYGERRGTWVYYTLSPDLKERLLTKIFSHLEQKVLA